MDLNRKAYISILLIAALCLTPYLALSFFSVPSADDFYFGLKARESGFPEYFQHFYNRFTGRIFPVTLFYLGPLSLAKPGLQFLFPLLTVAGLICSLIFLAMRVSAGLIPWRSSLLAGLLIVIVYLHRLPSTAETLYWTSGLLFYGLPTVLFIFWLGLMIKPGKGIFFLIAAALLSLLPAISNEVIPVPMAAIIALLWFDRGYRREHIKTLTISSIALMIGGTLLLAAPGNYARMGDFSHSPDAAWATGMAFANIAKAVAYQVQNPAIPLLALLILSNKVDGLQGQFPSPMIGRKGNILMLAGFIFSLWGMYFPSLFLSGYVPWRIHNVSSLIILLGFIMLLIRVSARIRPFHLPVWIRSFLILASMLLMLLDFQWRGRSSSPEFRGNTSLAWYELIYLAEPYYRQMRDRNTEASTSEGKALKFTGFSQVPRSLHFTGLKPAPEHDLNRWYADYFSLLEVRRDTLSVE